jgi:HSP20 family protein
MKFKDLVPWHVDDNWKDLDTSKSLGMHEAMDKFFDHYYNFGFKPDVFGKGESLFKTLTPKIDISESKTNVLVTAELPGLDEKEIDVHYSDHALVIKGEKRSEKEDKKKDYHRVERVYGSFNRTIPVPVEVDSEKIDAKFKNGVLEVTLPKTEEAKSKVKKIEVKTSN